jgi:hypothetical protein
VVPAATANWAVFSPFGASALDGGADVLDAIAGSATFA